jgi:hypothetical protein
VAGGCTEQGWLGAAHSRGRLPFIGSEIRDWFMGQRMGQLGMAHVMIFCFVLFCFVFSFLFSFFGLVLLDYISIFTYYRLKDKKGSVALSHLIALKTMDPCRQLC